MRHWSMIKSQGKQLVFKSYPAIGTTPEFAQLSQICF